MSATASQQQPRSLWMDIEALEYRLGQLQALLLNTHGAAFEAFSGWDDPIREDYLSHCAEFTGALRDQARDLMSRARQDSQGANSQR